MPVPGKLSSTLGLLANFLALVAFTLGAAPFTPAMVLVFGALPLALAAGFLGSWRLAIIALYFSSSAWFAVPVARELSIRVDYILIAMGVLGAHSTGLSRNSLRAPVAAS